MHLSQKKLETMTALYIFFIWKRIMLCQILCVQPFFSTFFFTIILRTKVSIILRTRVSNGISIFLHLYTSINGIRFFFYYTGIPGFFFNGKQGISHLFNSLPGNPIFLLNGRIVYRYAVGNTNLFPEIAISSFSANIWTFFLFPKSNSGHFCGTDWHAADLAENLYSVQGKPHFFCFFAASDGRRNFWFLF